MQIENEAASEVGLVATLIDKAVRQYVLYGPLHPQFLTALRDLESRMKELFTKLPEIRLTVKRTEFEWQGTVVFQNTKRENNYVQEMFVDGMREITFLPAITSEELQSLVAVLGRDLHSYEVREDDTVTLIWKKDFQNIRFQTVDVHSGDQLAFLQDAIEDLNEKQKDERDYFAQFVERLLDDKPLTPTPTIAEESTHAYHHKFAADLAQPIPADFFQPSEEDLVERIAQAQKEAQQDWLPGIATVFSEVLESKVDSEEFHALVDVVVSIAAEHFNRVEIRKASFWLKNLRAVQVHLGKTDLQAHEMIENEIVRFCAPARFKLLGEQISGGVSVRPEDLQQLLIYCGRKITPAVCELLACINQETIRTSIVEYLIAHCPSDIETYVSLLRRPESPLVRDVVRVLAELLDERVLSDTFSGVAEHPDPDVRLEVIRSMRKFSGDQSKHFLRRGIGDADSKVREMAFQLMNRAPHSDYARPLAILIKQQSFLRKSFEEKRLACLALARCAGTASFEFLVQAFESSLTGTEADELRSAALQAIAEIPGTTAMKFLVDVASQSRASKELKDLCARLLERKGVATEALDND